MYNYIYFALPIAGLPLIWLTICNRLPLALKVGIIMQSFYKPLIFNESKKIVV